MKKELLNKLVYLDNGYISNLYEVVTGLSAETKITRSEGFNAGVRIPLFTGGASSVESRSYSLSTLSMLSELYGTLEEFELFTKEAMELGKSSVVNWVTGHLSVFSVRVKESEKKEEKITAEDTYFGIDDEEGNKFALITSPEYFTTGINAAVKLNKTVIHQIDIPVKALLKIYSAKSSFKEWIAIPLVILEA